MILFVLSSSCFAQTTFKLPEFTKKNKNNFTEFFYEDVDTILKESKTKSIRILRDKKKAYGVQIKGKKKLFELKTNSLGDPISIYIDKTQLGYFVETNQYRSDRAWCNSIVPVFKIFNVLDAKLSSTIGYELSENQLEREKVFEKVLSMLQSVKLPIRDLFDQTSCDRFDP